MALSSSPYFWQNNINLFIALAPVTKLDWATSPLIKYVVDYQDYIKGVLDFAGIYEFYSISNSITTKYTCRLLPSLCRNVREFLLTSNSDLDDPERF